MYFTYTASAALFLSVTVLVWKYFKKITTKKVWPKSSYSVESLPSVQPSSKDVREHWFPVAFSEDVTNDKPYGINLLGEPVVLYRDGENRINCVIDKCPHRSAPLSEGKMVDGKLECLYHGWQFTTGGKCAKVPQAKKGSNMANIICAKTKAVHEELGFIWVYAGQASNANVEQIPRNLLHETLKPGWAYFQACVDADLDWTLLVDNLLDFAHIDFTHDGSIGNRKDASYVDVQEVKDAIYNKLHADAFSFKVSRPEAATEAKKNGPTQTFVPPCHVKLEIEFGGGKRFHQYFAVIPTAPGKMRLIYRFSRNFAAWKKFLITFLDLITSCKSLECELLMKMWLC
jgi:phenylpropionate dioxygenase-like ring-hydroxylating dioxygenase large terminal subunit